VLTRGWCDGQKFRTSLAEKDLRFLWEIFNTVDVGKTGSIKGPEIANLLRLIGLNNSQTDIDAAVAELDVVSRCSLTPMCPTQSSCNLLNLSSATALKKLGEEGGLFSPLPPFRACLMKNTMAISHVY
jgi:hypothetical protein